MASVAVAGSVAGCGYRPARGDVRWRTPKRYDDVFLFDDAILGTDWRKEVRVLEPNNDPGATTVPIEDVTGDLDGGDDMGSWDYYDRTHVGTIRAERGVELDGIAAFARCTGDALYLHTYPDTNPDRVDEWDKHPRGDPPEDASTFSLVKATPTVTLEERVPTATERSDGYGAEPPTTVDTTATTVGSNELVDVAVGGDRAYTATQDGSLVGYTTDLDEAFVEYDVVGATADDDGSFVDLAADDDGCAFLTGANGRTLKRHGAAGSHSWTTRVPAAASDSVVAVPGTVCTVGSRVAVFDAGTGDRRFVTDDLGAAVTTVATDDRSLYVGTDGRLQAVDVDPGGVRWRFPDASAGGSSVDEPVEVVDDVVIFGTGGRVVALDATDGSVLYEHASPDATFVGATSNALVFEAGDEYVARYR